MTDYLPSLPVFLAFASAAVLLALTPGPDMVYFVGRTLAGGVKAGIAAFAGAGAGLVVHSVLVAVGLAALLAASATAFVVLKVVGALYLLWLAFQTVRHGSSVRFEANGRSGQSLAATFMGGLAINLLNPKIIIFFMTFLPQFVDAHDPHAMGRLLVLGIGFIVVAAPVCLGLILAADRFAAALRRSPRILRVFDWLFAGLMASFAVRLIAARAG
ncbi:MAG TPA: LysE family translocator [Hyphomicrobiales bacterium]|nr:LysE family translocator [Kaistiaceae bacterium]HQF30410.1 LysE family translocator [Hyphomicrobiales bacterium]